MPNDLPLSYDLTARPWIPVQTLDGGENALSLREVFEQAHRLRRVVGDLPTQEFALIRLLLAILHDVLDGPADLDAWQQLWEAGLPVGDIADYLNDHRGRFDLLHPEQPFLQTADLRTAVDRIGSLDQLVADVPNGAPFFTMRVRGVDRLSFAEAARWLVHAHGFDTSGIKTGAYGDPRVKGGRVYPLGVAWAGNLGGVFVEGNDLRQTLLLNLIAFDTPTLNLAPDRDRPAWRHPPVGARPLDEPRRPAGLRDLYTWQSRRIRLHHDAEGVYGVVLAYGDALEPYNRFRLEPMTAWRRSPAQEKRRGLAQVYLPRAHDPARTAWRGLGALVAGRAEGAEQRAEAAEIVRPRILDWVARLTVEGDLPPKYLVRARLIGAVYGTQQSVIDEVVDDAVPLPVVLLHRDNAALAEAAIGAVGDAQAAVTATGDLAADLACAAGAEPEPPRTAVRVRAYAALDAPFREWLASLRVEHVPAERRAAWQGLAHRILSGLANELITDAGDRAWEGRIVTTRNGQELWLTAARADLIFRARLAKALPAAGEAGDRSTEPEEVRL